MRTRVILLFILSIIFVEKCSSERHTIHSTLNPHFKSDIQNPGSLSLVLFNSSTGAVCNDGTSGGFYWRKGYGTGSNKYVIHLEGGDWCTDPDSCIYRWSSSQDLMSSLPWTSSVILSEGLFSLDPLKNAWYNANFAYVGYCSSDNWSGNGSSSFVYNSKNYTLQFKGKQIIKTLIDVLYNDYNMINASEIMFSGCSAGGQGVVVNLDYVDNLLREEFPLSNENAVFRGVADAGWLQNLVPYSGDVGAESIATQMEEGYSFWHGVVDLTCKKSNPGWEWLCYISPYAYPHISTPIFIQTEQYDTYQVTSNCCNPPFDQGESVYIKQLREAFAFSLEEIRGNSSVFSAACFHHCLTEDTSFNTIQIGGLNMATALKNWFYFPSLPSKAIDYCQGFNCSVGCPEAPY